MAKFGEFRLVREDVGSAARLLYRVMGVADPAHYLHHRYLAAALRTARPRQPEAILDAGCGAGDHSLWLARLFPTARVLGVDIDAQRIAANRRALARVNAPNLSFEVGDLTVLQLDGEVDLIVSVDVLEHIVEQHEALTRLRRALRPGGYALLHVPTRRTTPVPLSRWLRDFHEWAEHEHIAEEATAEEFVQRVRSAGFEVVASRTTFGYWTGELATSLFALFHRDSTRNRILQATLAPICRVLSLLDAAVPQKRRHAILVIARRPA